MSGEADIRKVRPDEVRDPLSVFLVSRLFGPPELGLPFGSILY